MKALGLAVVIVVCLFSMVYVAIPDKQTHWGTKNCEIAEFSPDFTPQEKADCRLMRSKK
jgi:hypothetical protein